ncbi:hypothetical protein G7046_g8798 [Stylonectria norvegica]|nr:hypothetical protein G7046_g8798 [Stylonectria norvegica]
MRYSKMMALAMGNMASAQFFNTTTAATGSETGTATASLTGTDTDTSAPTGTAVPGNPATVGLFSFYGCVSSSAGFPGFVLELSSNDMTAELCGGSCAGSDAFGLFSGDCYCGPSPANSTSTLVSNDRCNLPCPGDDSESCGGNNLLARRQLAANILLSVFVNIGGGEPINTVTVNPTETATATSTFTQAGPTVTSVTNATAIVIPSDLIIICLGGYCAPQDCGCSEHYRVQPRPVQR